MPSFSQVLIPLLLGVGIFVLLLTAAFLALSMAIQKHPNWSRRLGKFAILLVSSQRVRQEVLDSLSYAGAGDTAPPFSIFDTEGAKFLLEEQRGKVVLLIFFATWCRPCLQELSHLQQFWDEHRENDRFVLLAIGRRETNQSVLAFRLKHGYTFPMAADPDRSVYGLYARDLIPRTYLVSQDGSICVASVGFDKGDFEKLKVELQSQFSRRH